MAVKVNMAVCQDCPYSRKYVHLKDARVWYKCKVAKAIVYDGCLLSKRCQKELNHALMAGLDVTANDRSDLSRAAKT